jgi:hypothetical protein
MDLLPQGCQFLEVLCGGVEDLPDLRSLGVGWSNGIVPLCQGDVAVRSQIDDDLGLAQKTMDVTRRMIVGVYDESNSAKGERPHGKEYTQIT